MEKAERQKVALQMIAMDLERLLRQAEANELSPLLIYLLDAARIDVQSSEAGRSK